MAYNTDLFDLIKSLSPSEKAYFKKYGYKQSSTEKGVKNNPYLLLFGAIDKQEEYNESKLLKLFEKEKFIRNFSATKAYLYSIVLDSIVSCNEGKSQTDQILVLLREIEALSRKGLSRQCLKKIDAAMKKAQQHEQWSLFCYLLFEQLKNTDFYSELNNVYYEDVIKQIQQYTELIHHDIDVALLLRTFHVKWRQLGMIARSEEQIAELHQIMQHPFLQDETRALTIQSKLAFYNIQAVYQTFLNNPTAIHSFLSKGIELFERNPYLIENNLCEYIHFLDMQLGVLMGREMWLEFDVCIVKLRNLLNTESNKLKAEDAALYQSGCKILQLLRHFKTWDIEAALAFVEPIKALHALFPTHKHIITGNLYFIARSYFMLGMFDEALIEINEALTIEEVENFSDYYAGLRIINLLIHLELKNEQLLEYILRATYRFLKDRKRMFVIENLFLKFLKKLLSAPDKGQIDLLYSEFYENINKAIAAYPKEIAALRLFDFRFWLESKIKKIPMNELSKIYKAGSKHSE